MKIEFGSRVKSNFKLVRKTEKAPDYGDLKTWAPTPCEVSGIFLGYRTLSNGTRFYDCEEGYSFQHRGTVKAAVICPGPNRNSVYVPADSVEGED